MKLDKVGQSALLKLNEIDLEITRLTLEIKNLVNSAELVDLNNQLAQLAEPVISARTALENLQVESKKTEEDLRLVTERLIRDRERLIHSSNTKDIAGIQSEIVSLETRKASLEEVELAILENIEQAELRLSSILTDKNNLQSDITSLQNKLQIQIDDLKSQGRKLSADRQIVVGKISADVLQKYDSLSKRGVAVGQIIDRACSACRMNMTVGFIDSLKSLDEDEVGTCPECQAIIIV
ncbi:MAG: hypothetical protein RIQ88_582 [Actinomycetota bacterium]